MTLTLKAVTGRRVDLRQSGQSVGLRTAVSRCQCAVWLKWAATFINRLTAWFRCTVVTFRIESKTAVWFAALPRVCGLMVCVAKQERCVSFSGRQGSSPLCLCLCSS